jgi:hypothetical protein
MSSLARILRNAHARHAGGQQLKDARRLVELQTRLAHEIQSNRIGLSFELSVQRPIMTKRGYTNELNYSINAFDARISCRAVPRMVQIETQ